MEYVLGSNICWLVFMSLLRHTKYIDGLVQKDVTPLLMHWSYVFLALTHRYVLTRHPKLGCWYLHHCNQFGGVTLKDKGKIGHYLGPVSISKRCLILRSHKVSKPLDWINNGLIALKFDRHLGSSAAEVPVKFQSYHTILTTNLVALRLCEVLQ